MEQQNPEIENNSPEESKVTRKAGRPRIPIDFNVIERYAAAGLTDYQMSLCLRVSETTLKKWKRDERTGPQIRAAIKKGQGESNKHVVASLYKRAVGYSFEKITNEEKVTKDGDVVPVVKVERVDVAPSEIAAMMWLSNKDPDNWKQKQDIGITQNTRVVAVELKGLDAEGRRNLIKQFEAERQRRLGAGKVQPSQTPIEAKFEEVPARIEKQGPEDAPGAAIESAPDP